MDIPQAVVDFFNGRDLEHKQGLAAYLLTTTEDGWPHSAAVSVGEVLLAPDAPGVRLALWPASRTTASLSRTGQAVLLLVLDGASHRLRLALRPASPPAPSPLAFFAGEVVEAVADVAPYARLVDGVRFTLTDPDATLSRWRGTVELLRAARPAPQGPA